MSKYEHSKTHTHTHKIKLHKQRFWVNCVFAFLFYFWIDTPHTDTHLHQLLFSNQILFLKLSNFIYFLFFFYFFFSFWLDQDDVSFGSTDWSSHFSMCSHRSRLERREISSMRSCWDANLRFSEAPSTPRIRSSFFFFLMFFVCPPKII